jgi:hypothetical protein
MNADPRRERLEELLADRALVGLTAAEEAELAHLAAETGAGDERELELAAAALDLASWVEPSRAPRSCASASLRARGRSIRPTRSRRSADAHRASRRAGGWLAAEAARPVAFPRPAHPGVCRGTPAVRRRAPRADTLRRD